MVADSRTIRLRSDRWKMTVKLIPSTLNRIASVAATILVVFCLLPNPANADWINLSGAENASNIAEIHINDDHVRIDLEIYVNDLVTFDRLLPDEFFEGTDIKRAPLAERLRQFSEEDFQIITDEGRKIRAKLQLTSLRLRKERPSRYAGKINPYTRQRMPGPPEDKRVLYVELVYPFDKRPKALTIIPPLDEEGRGLVAIGFVTYHKEVLITDFRYLPQSSTVRLDWDDPWYSGFEAPGLKRWQRGSVMSFLYVEPFEVRHEILARVKDLTAWLDLGLRGDEYIEADENDSLKKRVGEFFLEKDRLLIDGEQLRPILDRTAFVKYSMTGSTFLEQPERIPINNAMVGVIITYLTSEMPKHVEYEWNLWSERIQKIPTDAIDPAGGLPSYVTPESNVMSWTNYLKTYEPPTVAGVALDESMTTWRIPIASVLFVLALVPIAWQLKNRQRNGREVAALAGLAVLLVVGSVVSYPLLRVAVSKPLSMATRMSDDDAVSLLNTLLNNVYRSFDFREEEDVYDKLATSVHGDLLSEIYLQNRRSLVVAQAGGAQARVKEVEILDADMTDGGARFVSFRARWTALGTVGHWGHIHSRKNQYDAEIIIEPVDNLWKITDIEVLEEERVL